MRRLALALFSILEANTSVPLQLPTPLLWECPRRLYRCRRVMATFILFTVSKRFADVRGYRGRALALLT